jgi:hypothetical protein
VCEISAEVGTSYDKGSHFLIRGFEHATHFRKIFSCILTNKQKEYHLPVTTVLQETEMDQNFTEAVT